MLIRALRRASAALACLGLVVAATVARADDSAANFPDHPIRVIVSMSPGGGVDAVTRILASQMQVELGQAVPVENKPGAGGNVAAEDIFHTTPDGYTLLSSPPAPITTNAYLYKALNYDPAGLKPVVIMSRIPNVLLVKQDLPVKTVQELIAYAKANPGKLNYASQGIGTTSHLTAALFAELTKTSLVHVPYKGTAPALNDLIAGNVDMMFTELATSMELHKAGRARILAVATKERVASLPDTPTLAEAGVAGCESDTWNALTAPPQTPDSVVAKLNAAANKALKSAALVERFQKLDLNPGGGTPAEMAAFVKSETLRWGNVIHDLGIKPE
jgi:tripartite-type tricarboxylate transporter receptor subunit TctC